MGYAHENWSARKWRRVLFSDESTFTQFQQGHQGKIWREPGEELNPNCISVTVKHSPITGQIYAITIKDYVVPTLQRHFSQGNGIFQEDNASSHRLKVATAARENARIVIVNWAILIFEKTHPSAIAVFAFDNSSSHGKYADNALNANHINLNLSEKQAKLRNIIFNGQIQHMNFPNNYYNKNLRKKLKGMKIILEEREIIEAKGHKVIFYSKFYCELNYIEMYWGAAKRYAHQQYDYSWTELQRVVPLVLDSVPVSHIRKYARKSA
ncbi:unnamed protein product [Rhizophagus irregularis]|nr:unnamed protein product [Rhizophagus irregularis]